jgi:predicted permease
MSPTLNEFRLRLKSLFHKRRMDRDMTEELAFHQALLREKLLREGVPQSEVDAAASRTFGNSTRWHERLRELWQFPLLENLQRDVVFSLRLLRKSPGFTTVALLTLALGVGANTAIFSLVNGLLLRPLSVPHSEQLIVLRMDQRNARRGPNYVFPLPIARALEQKHDIFSDVFAYSSTLFILHGQSGNDQVSGQYVSGEYFRALQVPAELGRTLNPEDDRPEGSLAVVISDRLWKDRFQQNPNVTGKTLRISNTVFTIVGVMPASFRGANPIQAPVVYLPLAAEAVVDAPNSITAAGGDASWLTLMARGRQGITLDQVNSALLPASMPIVKAVVPNAGWIARAEKNQFHFAAERGSGGFNFLRISFRKPLFAVFAMCGGILLLACLNLASLLMARGASRERELATRLALGAARTRLVMQMLIESLIIALGGTAIGLAAAPLVSRSLAAILVGSRGSLNMNIDTALDFRVIAFAAVTAIAASLLIGFVPALAATSGTLSDHIKEGQGPAHARERRSLLPRIMLAFEVGLALTLVIGAGLLAASLTRLYKSGAGFDPDGLTAVIFNMDRDSIVGNDALAQRYRQIVEGLTHQPGVKNISVTLSLPFYGFVWDEDHNLPGQPSHDLDLDAIGPDYFRTMRIPLLAGREFTWADDASSGLKIILNRAAADLFFPGGNPIGQHISRKGVQAPFEIVGVVGDAKYSDMHEPAPPAAYFPIAQNTERMKSYAVIVRGSGPLAPLASTARTLTRRVAPDVPSPLVITLKTILDDSISSERIMALLSAYFAVCALLVTAIGLYGTLSYATARRTSEIGIRMALGAGRATVARMVLRENAAVAFSGVLAGLVVALLAARALSSFLYGTSAHDPLVLAASVLALAVVAAAASLIPALRAARIEPMAAIRCE